MRDIGGLVWIVFVLFAVVSSIVKSARRSRGVPAPARSTQLIAQFHQQAQVVTPPQPVAQPQPVAPPQPAAQPIPPPPQIVRTPQPPAPRVVAPAQPQQRPGFFAGRGALVRGIVAAEVLGKPLALRDE